MSLATRCTHCGTIFKVVQDQLKVSEGWVRCGRCHEVFNALPTLFDLEKDPPPPRPHPLPVQAELANGPSEPAPTPDAEPALHQDTAPHWADAQPSEFPATAPAEFDPAPSFEQNATSPTHTQEAHHDQDGQHAQVTQHHDPALPPAPAEPASISNLLAASDFELDTAVSLGEGHPAQGLSRGSDSAPGLTPEFAPTFAPEADPEPAQQALSQPAWQPVWASDLPGSDTSDTATTEIADMGLTLSDQPRPWQQPPPSDEDLPSTDEADALDSRYLLPTPRERKPAYLRQSGPEFADAQFPSDALMDEEDEWGGPQQPSSRTPPPLPSTAAGSRALMDAASQPLPLTGLRGGGQAEPDLLADATVAVPNEALSVQAGPPSDQNTPPTPLSSRFGEDFIPEMAVEPPSQRKGKPGARATATPEFMRRAQRQAFWRHPATRAVMAVMALSLLLGLGLQVAHQFRDLLAAYHPPLRPYLAQLCEVAGCTIQPPLSLDKLEVESATLVRATSEGPDRYRLAVVVHNKAPIDLAWPHVDLTLTDANGTVIARRAFSPDDADWIDTADAAADMPPHSGLTRSRPVAVPSSRSTTLLWQLRAPQLQPAGYTAELFYP